MYAALDISLNRIGIAFSTRDKTAIEWAGTIKNKPNILKDLYRKYKPEKTLIGLSTHPNGNLTSNGKFVCLFTNDNTFLVPFEYVEEYLSTQEAKIVKERLKMKIEIDTLVAKIMLYKHLKIESALLYYGLYY